jgi:hypothetical protein
MCIRPLDHSLYPTRPLPPTPTNTHPHPPTPTPFPPCVTQDNCESLWNLQADATATHYMDFSNYFVFPGSCLHEDWHMQHDTVRQH